MKPNLLFIALATMFSFCVSAQRSSRVPVNLGISKLVSETVPEGGEVIVGYKVEERINLRFGGRVTTYKVSSLSMVSKVDLGPDNRRIITPIYGKAKPKPIVSESQIAMAGTVAATFAPKTGEMKFATGKIESVKRKVLVEADPEPVVAPAPVAVAAPVVAAPAKVEPAAMEVTSTNADGTVRTAKINILHTYERTLERGYQSADMLKRVANLRFFDGDLAKAGKWYSELYKINPNDWEPIMYYRYAQCLKAMNQQAKSDEMMKIFKTKDK